MAKTIEKERLSRKKRARQNTAKEATGSNALEKLSLKHKYEAVLSWQCSGYVFDGKRMSGLQLAGSLGLTPLQLDRLIEQVKRGFVKQYGESESVRRHVFCVIGTLLYQIREDRARAEIYADQLERQIARVSEELDKAYLLPEGEPNEYAKKRQKISNFMYYLKNLNSQKAESLRILTQTSESLKNFLGLFSDGNDKRLPIPNIYVEVHPGSGNNQPIYFTDAIRLIESKIAPNLPRQDPNAYEHEARNPNQGFEEFEANRDETN